MTVRTYYRSSQITTSMGIATIGTLSILFVSRTPITNSTIMNPWADLASSQVATFVIIAISGYACKAMRALTMFVIGVTMITNCSIMTFAAFSGGDNIKATGFWTYDIITPFFYLTVDIIHKFLVHIHRIVI